MKLMVKRLIRFNGAGSLKGCCDIEFGGFIQAKGLRIVQGKERLFVSMPRTQGKDGHWYEEIIPVTKVAEQQIEQAVLSAYEKER